MNYSIFLPITIALMLSAAAIADGDIAKGKAKSAACAGCHGANGIAIAPNFPNLAGQKYLYLTKAIAAYRDGVRNDPTMKAMTAALTDADIENLGAYFSNLPSKK
ncbi:MAG: c-type cytochrome [Candidatus Thioglobus sp.]|nr:c-type cytochrome [Candidatus Thioglobus sp.]